MAARQPEPVLATSFGAAVDAIPKSGFDDGASSYTCRYSLLILVTSKTLSDFLLYKRSEQVVVHLSFGVWIEGFRGGLVFEAHRLTDS